MHKNTIDISLNGPNPQTHIQVVTQKILSTNTEQVDGQYVSPLSLSNCISPPAKTNARRSIMSLDRVNENPNNMDESDVSGGEEQMSDICGSEIPRYLVKPSPLDQFTVDFRNILADIEENGDGGDSDVDGDVAGDLDMEVKEANNQIVQFQDDENAVLLLDDNITVFDESVEKKNYSIDLSSYIPDVPSDWIAPEAKVHLSEPSDFTSIDNPGNWK